MQCFLLLKHLLFIFTKPKSTLHIWEQLTNGLAFLGRLIIHFHIFNKRLWAWGPTDETGLLPLRSQGHLLMKNPGQGITWKSAVQGHLPEGGHWHWNLTRWQRVGVMHQAAARTGWNPERQEDVYPAEVVQAGSTSLPACAVLCEAHRSRGRAGSDSLRWTMSDSWSPKKKV